MLPDLIKRAKAAYDAMTPEQKAEHDRKQRESFVRGMLPAGHGMTRDEIHYRIAEINGELAGYSNWGAAYGALIEEREELENALRRNSNE